MSLISNTNRVPIMSVGFDPTHASGGAAALAYKALIFGQRLSTGTVSTNRLDLISSPSQAAGLYGAGSQLSLAVAAWLANNTQTQLYAVSLADAGAGVAATWTVTFTGPASAAGTISLYVNGVKASVAVAASDSVTTIAAAVAAAITASMPVSATAAVGVVTLTAKNKGVCGNSINVQINYGSDEALPAGVGCAIAAGTDGATNPSVADAITVLNDDWYNVIVTPWTDSANMGLLETELRSRFDETRMIDAVAIAAYRPARSVATRADALSALVTYGTTGRNCPHVIMLPMYKELQSPVEFAASAAAQIAKSAENDPGEPFLTLPLNGISAAASADRFKFSERNTLLFSGIATTTTDAGGVVRLERTITMYRTNTAGTPDTAYLDSYVMFQLMYWRYSWRVWIGTRYPKARLADDASRIGPGISVITPKIGKSEVVAWARSLEVRALIQNVDEFKKTVTCQRSTVDPNRLEWIIDPQLMNQFMIGATDIRFILQR